MDAGRGGAARLGRRKRMLLDAAGRVSGTTDQRAICADIAGACEAMGVAAKIRIGRRRGVKQGCICRRQKRRPCGCRSGSSCLRWRSGVARWSRGCRPRREPPLLSARALQGRPHPRSEPCGREESLRRHGSERTQVQAALTHAQDDLVQARIRINVAPNPQRERAQTPETLSLGGKNAAR